MRKIIEGQLGLSKTFWAFLFIPNISANIIVLTVHTTLPEIILFILAVLFITYLISAMIGVWNAGKTYNGNFIWLLLSRIYIGMIALSMLTGLLIGN